jgi:hypothetical protein
MSKSSLISPGLSISVHLRVPPSTSSKPSVLRVGAACLKLFVVLGIVGKLWVTRSAPDPGPLRLLFREEKPEAVFLAVDRDSYEAVSVEVMTVLREFGVEGRVTEVHPGTPAAGVGLRPGDLITAFDGDPVTSMADLAARVRPTAPGTRVRLDVVRGGATIEVEVRIGRQ